MPIDEVGGCLWNNTIVPSLPKYTGHRGLLLSAWILLLFWFKAQRASMRIEQWSLEGGDLLMTNSRASSSYIRCLLTELNRGQRRLAGAVHWEKEWGQGPDRKPRIEIKKLEVKKIQTISYFAWGHLKMMSKPKEMFSDINYSLQKKQSQEKK